MRRASMVVVVAVVMIAATAGGSWWWLGRSFDRIPTFDETALPRSVGTEPDTPAISAPPLVLPEPPPGGVVTVLVFGVGSEGVDAAEGARTGVNRTRLSHRDGLTDTIMLAVIDTATAQVAVVSIPRDTWISHRRSKINAVYVRDGAQALADEVTSLTGVPVHHMVAVNFAGVTDVVDTWGGVEVQLAAPIRDRSTGLALPAGCAHLDGPTVLGVLRSRKVEVFDGTRWKLDQTADLGRIVRTQQLLKALASEVSWRTFPARLPSLFTVAADNIVRDRGLTLDRVLDIARRLAGGAEVHTWTPPVRTARKGSASVVEWRPEAAAVLDRLAAAVAAGRLAGDELEPGVAGTMEGPSGSGALSDAPDPTPEGPAVPLIRAGCDPG